MTTTHAQTLGQSSLPTMSDLVDTSRTRNKSIFNQIDEARLPLSLGLADVAQSTSIQILGL